MAELAVALRKLFAGEASGATRFLLWLPIFILTRKSPRFASKPARRSGLYYGPSLLKPAVLELIARHFDGVIMQTLYGIAEHVIIFL